MLRQIAKVVGIVLAAVLLIGGVLYLLGMRLMLDGGGTPHVAWVESEATREERLARHREAQRAASPAPAAAQAEPGESKREPAAPPGSGAEGATSGAAPSEAAAAATEAPPPSPVVAPYWTDFRGPLRDGHYAERPVLTTWPEDGLTPMWKQPVGGGYSSFVIARGRAFTIEQRGDEEVATAYDVATGRELWANAWAARFRELMGGDGPRATPAWADGVVYALGATGELRALEDSSGRLLWRTNILTDAGADNLQWGMAASPLIVEDTVVVLPGGGNGRSVAAYDRRTGTLAWSALDDKQAYSSPMLVTLAGVRQLLVFAATRLMGIVPGTGEILWEFPWKTQYDAHASQPLVIDNGRVFISTGYGTGAALIALSSADGRLSARQVWRSTRMKNQFTSSLFHDGFIYGLDESILACLDAATGELKWKGGRYGYGQVMLASGRLLVLTEDGDLALVRATPARHDEIARFSVLEGRTWNHPAMAGGILLVRNINEMAAFDLRVPAAGR